MKEEEGMVAAALARRACRTERFSRGGQACSYTELFVYGMKEEEGVAAAALVRRACKAE
jgi:hypothetical protein